MYASIWRIPFVLCLIWKHVLKGERTPIYVLCTSATSVALGGALVVPVGLLRSLRGEVSADIINMELAELLMKSEEKC